MKPKIILVFLILLKESRQDVGSEDLSKTIQAQLRSERDQVSARIAAKESHKALQRVKPEPIVIVRQASSVLIPFEDQLAGRASRENAFLKDSRGHLLKPDPMEREINFYEAVSMTTEDPVILELRKIIPQYFGIRDILIGEQPRKFLYEENLLDGYQMPCVMDVKIGRIRKLPEDVPASPRQWAKCLAMREKWAFSFPGFKYHDLKNRTLVQEGKEFGYTCMPSTAIRTLYSYVNGKLGIKCKVVSKILDSLRNIYAWHEQQRHYLFVDSSILLTYDAIELEKFLDDRMMVDSPDDEDFAGSCEDVDVTVRVRMIDFEKTIVLPENMRDEADENYLKGVRNMIYVFENLEELYQQSFNEDV